jgi:hypothetical protein
VDGRADLRTRLTGSQQILAVARLAVAAKRLGARARSGSAHVAGAALPHARDGVEPAVRLEALVRRGHRRTSPAVSAPSPVRGQPAAGARQARQRLVVPGRPACWLADRSASRDLLGRSTESIVGYDRGRDRNRTKRAPRCTWWRVGSRPPYGLMLNATGRQRATASRPSGCRTPADRPACGSWPGCRPRAVPRLPSCRLRSRCRCAGWATRSSCAR